MNVFWLLIENRARNNAMQIRQLKYSLFFLKIQMFNCAM
jgi:hypothetical protein